MSLDEVLADLVAEQDALDEVVAALDDEAWATPTASPGWTVHDQIAHLTYFDATARQAVVDPEGFAAGLVTLLSSMADGPEAADAATLGPLRALTPSELLERWRAGRAALAAAGADLAPDARVPWYGPSMGARSFVTARLMEAWAHGQDVVDATGSERLPTDRIRHIAQLGFITRGWSYRNRRMSVPEVDVALTLRAPSGDVWTWGDQDAPERIEGSAFDFCLVVTQRRHLDATDLVTSGPASREWMSLAQAFAGPPTDGPAPA